MPESLPTLLGSLLSVHSRRGAQRPLLFLARTQTNFLKSLRRCDRKGDVAIVLEVPPACPSTHQQWPIRRVAVAVAVAVGFATFTDAFNLAGCVPCTAAHRTRLSAENSTTAGTQVEKQLLRELNVGKDIANNAVRPPPTALS